MLKRTILFILILLFMVLAIPELAQLAEAREDFAAEVDTILDRYIRAIGGREAIEKINTRICIGRIITDLKSRQEPIYEDHHFEAYAKIPDLYYTVEYSDAGRFYSGYDGTTGWSKDRCGIKRDDYYAKSKLAFLLNPQNALKIKEYFPNLVLKGKKQVGGKTAFHLISTDRDETYYGLYFDVDTGLLIRIGCYLDLGDYREVDGVLFPYRISTSRKGGSTTYIFKEVIHNQPIEDYMFKIKEE